MMNKKIIEYLKDNVSQVLPPKWATFVKTGSYLEEAPIQTDWWYKRCSSILRKIYIRGPLGIDRLKKEYGGRRAKGNVGKHKGKGSEAIIRVSLQQLEEAGLVEIKKSKGRILTSKGKSIIDRLAFEVKKELDKSIPELKKY